MREYASKLLDKALDAIEAAELLTNMGKAEIAAGRAYYAMFYIAEALLFNQFDLKLNQHGQVIAAYGKHFAKTKELDPKYHRWLRDGFEKRISGDSEFPDYPEIFLRARDYRGAEGDLTPDPSPIKGEGGLGGLDWLQYLDESSP